MIALILLSLAIDRTQPVDLIEVNHVHNKQGNHAFTQVIFWDIDPPTRKLHVRDWCLIENVREIQIRPQGPWLRLCDGTTLKARMYRESWTQTDPEREDLMVWPDRISLLRCKK